MFYISSYGGSATLWLASSFSKHPDVVCFHGSQCFPPNPYNRNQVTPEEFVAALKDCEFATRDRKIFGHVHGFHGLSAKEATEAAGGVFVGMLRHPLRRMHSLFSHEYHHRRGLPVSNGDIYRTIKEQGLASLNPMQALNGTEFRLNEVEGVFHWVCHGTLEHDLACIEGLPPNRLAQMEELVVDRERLAALFRLCTQGRAPVTSDFLDYCFEENTRDTDVLNAHSLQRRDTDETYRQWPWSFKAVLALCAARFGVERVLTAYASQGYHLPPEALDIVGLLRAA